MFLGCAFRKSWIIKLSVWRVYDSLVEPIQSYGIIICGAHFFNKYGLLANNKRFWAGKHVRENVTNQH